LKEASQLLIDCGSFPEARDEKDGRGHGKIGPLASKCRLMSRPIGVVARLMVVKVVESRERFDGRAIARESYIKT
jgi:hypothetical protein